MEKIASGRRGNIYLEKIGKKKIATKKANDTFMNAAINKEVQLLEYLHKHKINFVPKVLSKQDGSFSYERIEGEHFRDFWKIANKKDKYKAALQLVNHAYKLDKLGIIHGELIRPTTNVLIDKNQNISIIDFERGKQGDFSGRNMKNVSQRMHRNGYISLETIKKMGKSNSETIYKVLKKALSTEKNIVGIILGGGLLIDLFTKWVFYNKTFGEELLLLTPILNTGVGRSIPVPHLVTLVLTGCIIMLLCYFVRKKELPIVGGTLLISGALGNFYDRIVYSGVRDFIDLQYRAIFNVADVLITIGVIIILYKLLRGTQQEANKK